MIDTAARSIWIDGLFFLNFLLVSNPFSSHYNHPGIGREVVNEVEDWIGSIGELVKV